MQTYTNGSRSVITEGNSLHTTLSSLGYSNSIDRQSENHVMAGSVVPLSTLGEAMNNLACGQMVSCVTAANSGEYSSMQPGRGGRDFSTGASYPQIRSVQDTDLFVEDMALQPSSVVENQGKLTTSGPFAYPFECTRTAIASNSSCPGNSSFETMNYGLEDLPFDISARWEFNKFMIPPELVGKIIGRTGVKPVHPTASCLPNDWMMTQQGDLNCESPGSSRFSNELSLSLATSQPSGVHGNSTQDQCSEISSSGSRFIRAMQEILAEIACYALENTEHMSCSGTGIGNGRNVPHASSSIDGKGYRANGFSDGIDMDLTFMSQDSNLFQGREVEAKKKHLLALLQVVDDRYNQCLDEIHTVTSAFHAVTELDPNLHARFALPTISFMYKNLRERISSHILEIGANLSEGESREEKSFETRFIQKQWALQQLSKRDHQLWRPQRGLPERSVSVLRAWMFQNFLHPYPKDAEKHLLALKSGLTRNQVSNWFINARVRLWKPMIEEMYAEMNRRKARRSNEETEGNLRNQMSFDNTRFTVD